MVAFSDPLGKGAAALDEVVGVVSTKYRENPYTAIIATTGYAPFDPMMTLARIRDLINTTLSSSNSRPSVARLLLEQASGQAGLDAHQAQDLRRAALASLSLVR